MKSLTAFLALFLCFLSVRGQTIQLGDACQLAYAYPYSPDEIQIQLKCNNQGWIAFGIGSSMTASDIIVCSSSNGAFSVYDMYGVGEKPPVLDPSQDVSLEASQRTSDYTECTLRRKLVTPDTANDLPITLNAPLSLIWAFGNSDNLSYHDSNRGIVTATFNSAQTFLKK